MSSVEPQRNPKRSGVAPGVVVERTATQSVGAGAAQQPPALQDATTLLARLHREVTQADGDRLPEDDGSWTYDIIIPVYNAVALLRTCVESLVRHTHERHRVLLIDDCSPDPDVEVFCRDLCAAQSRFHYARLPQNLGFPGAVNAGLERSQGDVVLLNSDTEVSPGWLERLHRCRQQDTRIQIVSPLSNHATICSVPQMNHKNSLPAGLTVDAMAEQVARTSLRRYPRVPTAVGFCMLVTRRVLDEIGGLDLAFGRGYGEEVDWCQRAWARGHESAICDDAYVYHHGEASYSDVPEKQQLQRDNDRLVAQRWPRYHENVLSWCTMNPLRLQHQRLATALRSRRRTTQLDGRVLHVAHSWDALGGTELHTRSIVEQTHDHFDNAVLYPAPLRSWTDATVIDQEEGPLLVRMNQGLLRDSQFFRGAPASLRSRVIERFFLETLEGLQPDVVHFQHLLHFGSFQLPALARAWGAAVVVSLHDYFLLCPDWNLMNAAGRLCGRDQVRDDRDCLSCLESKRTDSQDGTWFDLPQWIQQRQDATRATLEVADRIIAPSAFVRQQFTRAMGKEVGGRIDVIPHGTRRSTIPARNQQESASGPLRVVFLGHLAPTKGRQQFLEAAARLQRHDIRLKVLGGTGIEPMPPGLDNIEFFGSFQPDELPHLLGQADVALILSVWHETYCLTLDEAFGAGLPVIATRVGAIQERIEHENTGLLIEPDDVDALVQGIRRLDADRGLLQRLQHGVAQLQPKSLEDNCDEYASLYRQVVGQTTERRRQAPTQSHATAVAPTIGASLSELIRQRMRRNRMPVGPGATPLTTASAAKGVVTL